MPPTPISSRLCTRPANQHVSTTRVAPVRRHLPRQGDPAPRASPEAWGGHRAHDDEIPDGRLDDAPRHGCHSFACPRGSVGAACLPARRDVRQGRRLASAAGQRPGQAGIAGGPPSDRARPGYAHQWPRDQPGPERHRPESRRPADDHRQRRHLVCSRDPRHPADPSRSHNDKTGSPRPPKAALETHRPHDRDHRPPGRAAQQGLDEMAPSACSVTDTRSLSRSNHFQPNTVAVADTHFGQPVERSLRCCHADRRGTRLARGIRR